MLHKHTGQFYSSEVLLVLSLATDKEAGPRLQFQLSLLENQEWGIVGVNFMGHLLHDDIPLGWKLHIVYVGLVSMSRRFPC